ncbi:MAG TPA: Gfo/Idh/MocA family oxidoreductase [Candidatus Krumholzibacteria bacterium]|nr:Gfo/Idh/MocA family oxidoreductase [Candidatus Krumholzibacteria bacterium]
MTTRGVKLKVAIVGCGKIADAHVEEVGKLAAAEVVAVCDREPLMAEQLAARYGVPRHFSDFAALLTEVRPDVVHITTPPQSHLALAAQSLDAGCHVYIEKPFALNRAESLTIIEHARRVARKVTVGHSFAFDPLTVELRRLRDEGFLGDTVHVESHLGYNLSGAFGAALMGDRAHWVHGLPGKLFHNNLDHVLHKIEDFIPEDAPTLVARATRRLPAGFGDERDDLMDELRVLIEGAHATACATFSSHAVPVRHYARVWGTRNTVTADYVSRVLVVEQGENYPSAIGRLLPAFAQARQYGRGGAKNIRRFMKSEFQFFTGMNELFRRFYHSIQDDGEPPIAYDRIVRISGWMDDVFAQVNAALPRREVGR